MNTLVLSEEEKVFCRNLLSLFKIDGVPADQCVTEGQMLIFAALVLRKSHRIQITTSTQYGKSLIVALACLVLSCIEGEMISIPAPTEDKAKIIMRYYLQHISDHPVFYSQLEKHDKLDRLVMETSRDRLILKNRGGVFILSVQAGNSEKGFQAAMGEGSKIVIQDESALIPDNIEATIYRMIAGKKDAMYVKIGNPFYRNHFYTSSQDPRYLQIYIDYVQGLKEGRYNYDFIEEARTKPNFDILYGCKFPSEDIMGADGYVRLLSDKELEMVQTPYSEHVGLVVLGVDPAAGGDNSTIVKKSSNLQEILFNQPLNDVMDLCGVIADLYGTHGASAVVVDKTGVGQGVYDRLNQMGMEVKGVSFAEKPEDPMFQNRKAELYWKQREWLLRGGRLLKSGAWEFKNIKYKNKDGRVIMQPKEELFKMGLQSPNCVDAAVLTQAVSTSGIQNLKKWKMQGGQFHDRMKDVWNG